MANIKSKASGPAGRIISRRGGVAIMKSVDLMDVRNYTRPPLAGLVDAPVCMPEMTQNQLHPPRELVHTVRHSAGYRRAITRARHGLAGVTRLRWAKEGAGTKNDMSSKNCFTRFDVTCVYWLTILAMRLPRGRQMTETEKGINQNCIQEWKRF